MPPKPPTPAKAIKQPEVTLAIESIRPDPANLRKHDERSIEAIAASLARFGQQKPIVIDDKNVVIAGHGVLEGARRLGWKQIRATRSNLSGAERVAYGIADNRIPELSSWDEPALKLMLESMDPDLIHAAGFAANELEEFLRGGEGADPLANDEIPEPPEVATSRRGDLWLLGSHRLLCGDSGNDQDVQRLMDGNRAVLFATDPPYLVNYDGTNHGIKKLGKGGKDWSDGYGKTWDDADENSDLYERFIGAAVRHAIAPDAAWYCWHASKRQAMLEAEWNKAGARVHCQILWCKNVSVFTRTWYLWQHEPCFFGWIKKPKKCEKKMYSTVWHMDTIPNGEDRPNHPTPKPLESVAIPIRQHTDPGDICYEPFSGSGTHIIAAEQLGRRCFAMEIEPKYVDVAIERWEKLTGKQAKLAETGKSYQDVRAKRAAAPEASKASSNRACRTNPKDPADTRGATKPATAPTAKPMPPSTNEKPGKAPKAPPHRAGTGRSGKSSARTS